MSHTLTEIQQHWAEQLQRTERSGITVADYTRAHNLKPQKLYQCRSALKKQVITSMTTETHFAKVMAVPSATYLLAVHLPSA